MKRWGNKNWIAGTLAAVCALAVACFVAWPGASQPADGGSPSHHSIDVDLPASQADAGSGISNDEQAVALDSPQSEEEPFGGMEYQEGVVLVTLPAGVSPADAVAAIVEETGLQGVGLAHAEDAYAAAATAAEEPAFVELAVPANMSVQDAVGIIGASNAVDAVQPNFVYHLNDASDDVESNAHEQLMAQNYIVQELVTQAATNDPGLSRQWALESIYATGDTSNNKRNAWDVTTTNKAVAVAVIDEGFQADHSDLKNNVVATYNAATKDADVSEVGSDNHGTHVAGIVAAEANNNVGVAGVSYNANLVLVKGYDETKGSNGKVRGFTTAAMHEAFSYISRVKGTYNIRVINMSIGGYQSSAEGWSDYQLIKDIDSATKSGIVVVCSGGNSPIADSDGTNHNAPYIDYPANYSSVVGVINLQENGNDPHNVSRASSSNYNMPATSESSMNTGLNISAPGTDIYSTIPTSTYGNKNGTSMAAPCVAGVLALAFTANPNLTAAEATSLLYSTATDINSSGWDRETGYGEVNAYNVVTKTDEYVSGGTTLQVGKTVAFTAPGLGGWSWASSNTGVATVSRGVVTGVSRGTARISALLTVPFVGRLTRYQDVTVYDPAISGASSVTVGSSMTLSIPSTPSGSWTWTSSDTSVATVSGSGTSATVVGQKAGTATIRVALSSNADVYQEKRIVVTKADLSSATVTLPSSAYTYNGSAQKPTPTVKVGAVTLTAGSDYIVTYPSDCTNAGTKTLTVTAGASGKVKGSKSASYTINAASLSGATVALSPTSYTYDGTAKTPDVTVTVGGRTLAQGTDYAVSWPSGRADVGIYSVTVMGKGNYTGSASASFAVSAARQQLFRMYNPYSGEHHYTLSSNERDSLRSIGWKYEGVAWNCPSTSSTPVYRLYNPNSGDHHYTMDANEYSALARIGWKQEGVAWHSDDARGVALYRLFNPNVTIGTHHYTTDANERNALIRIGWKSEGTAWYGMA